MSNTRPIQPIQVWTPNGLKSATFLGLSDFFDYHFDNGGGMVTYLLIGMESQGTTTDENGNVVTLPDVAIEYIKDNLSIPSNIVNQWGASDDIIFNYVANTLNLTLI